MALHSPSIDPSEGSESDWPGEAKIAGTAVATDGGFCVDIAEVALTRVGTPTDHLVIEPWHAGRGYARRTRTCPGDRAGSAAWNSRCRIRPTTWR